MLHIIAAIADNYIIGVDNRIPWDIPDDLSHFKALTTGHTIIMGRKTFESIGRILPNRENIIVSSTWQYMDGAIVVSSLDEALRVASNEDVFVIGGAQLYQEALPLAEVLDITHVHLSPDGDTLFPKVNWQQYEIVWQQEHRSPTTGEPDYTFITYVRK